MTRTDVMLSDVYNDAPDEMQLTLCGLSADGDTICGTPDHEDMVSAIHAYVDNNNTADTTQNRRHTRHRPLTSRTRRGRDSRNEILPYTHKLTASESAGEDSRGDILVIHCSTPHCCCADYAAQQRDGQDSPNEILLVCDDKSQCRRRHRREPTHPPTHTLPLRRAQYPAMRRAQRRRYPVRLRAQQLLCHAHNGDKQELHAHAKTQSKTAKGSTPTRPRTRTSTPTPTT